MEEKNTENMVAEIANKSKNAAMTLQSVKVSEINKALVRMAELLESQKQSLQAENSKDLENGKNKGLSNAMLDRLTLSDKTITSMIRGLGEVAELKSCVGQKYDRRERPNGLIIEKMRVPIGVIGIIYESRPNVTIDAAAICLKSQNAVILRGGSEAFYSNMALASLFSQALEDTGLPKNALQVIPTTDRSAVEHMLKLENFIDLIIPRGGENLIRMVVEKSRIPVIKHYKGICHIYVSPNADESKALPIVVNAKVQRPGVCNAMETLILDSRLSADFKKKILSALQHKGVKIFGDEAILTFGENISTASESDWAEEYLDLRLAVKTVDSIDEAIAHINNYGSHHTDSILTESKEEMSKFITLVDSSSVIVNASTRFADGGEYGMGCEIGISTDKLHSRGPMGVEDLTTYKWVVEGNGQIRE
ncbi:glutamate-5-semialdehyde dehydrogenase [Chitinispirillales bacterium ANBcel5]|uniref:glutamate-5-semialdehyde dehydrogenase n=1 Tax=Cellulosispirillum alkaliphilum TaxID=3039283 RepID=UPI002A590C86|nr:glutamate-5-semialdehyde dehydrogenase [Chitinispirillales bacterium ANBcel5]